MAYQLLTTHQFDVTIFTPQSADEVRTGRIRSTQVHFSSTIARERLYRMPTWPNAQELTSVHVSVGGETFFAGSLDKPAYSIDQRLYFSECMADLQRQGVHFVYAKVSSEQLSGMVESFDLVVDCTGRSGPVAPFPLDSSMPKIATPLRKCSVGYFLGVENAKPVGILAHILPGEGELFEIPALTEVGPVTILFVEAVPGGQLDVFHRAHHAQDFCSIMLDITESFFPEIRNRLTREQFSLCDDHAYLRVAVRSEVHIPYCEVNGRFVVGCGDSVVLNDPITGQGDNTASYLTEQLFCALLDDASREWDETTFQSYWEKSKPYVNHVVSWSHAMLRPLPEHILGMIMEGRTNQAVADRIANWFRTPSSAYNDFFYKDEIHENGGHEQ
ncbi:styrene monooxygenase [Alicyclobacillus fastidiosus]|uniref:Styrene monooxygenase n=1 Tax=Alicyclobacillus fastidiosus TaxID=392011 RepID=A0ABY6ZBW3_9BACL|nr:styrene monooxygenase/indole monooxygenase family protein [Alicyclobacillus fastidiosus]WAH40023.1 styrene monooxygenase [Alicyclobacillus fastidiosus]GMA61322.1 alanine-phosphoribitol ligase [Alicyclobacillus fastidiosus]